MGYCHHRSHLRGGMGSSHEDDRTRETEMTISIIALALVMVAFAFVGLACLGIPSAIRTYINDKRMEREINAALREE